MLDDLKVEVSEKPETYDALFAWHVKVKKFGRQKMVCLMNDASKLGVVLYGMTARDFKNFDAIVVRALADVLADCGVSEGIIRAYFNDLGEAVFCQSGTRQQISTLNRAVLDLEYVF